MITKVCNDVGVCGFITSASSGDTLDTNTTLYFCTMTYGSDINITLPDYTQMLYKEIIVVVTTGYSENALTFYGTINGNADSSFDMTNQTIKFISDGNSWWITSLY